MQHSEEVGKRIREVREERRLTQKEFGDALGVSASYVSKLESGKESPSDVLSRLICLRFGVRPEWLLEGKPPKRLPIEVQLVLLAETYGYAALERYGLRVLAHPAFTAQVSKGGFPADWLRELENTPSVSQLDPSEVQAVKMAELMREVFAAWYKGDVNYRGWIYHQIMNALPDVAERIKKKEGLAGTSAGDGA